jgi:hypothetical protein
VTTFKDILDEVSEMDGSSEPLVNEEEGEEND